MIIKEAALFQGVSQKVINEIAGSSVEEIYKVGATLFESGQDAQYLYVLEDGSIDISVGERGSIQFVADELGEAFGWSALVEPYIYTASARCMKDSKVIKVSRETIEELVRKYPEDGVLIMRHLAGLIAQRLRDAYQTISNPVEVSTKPSEPSYG